MGWFGAALCPDFARNPPFLEQGSGTAKLQLLLQGQGQQFRPSPRSHPAPTAGYS